MFTGNKIRTSAWNGKEVGLCPQEFSVSFNPHYLSETAVDILIRWIVDPDAGEVLHRAAESPPPDVSLSHHNPLWRVYEEDHDGEVTDLTKSVVTPFFEPRNGVHVFIPHLPMRFHFVFLLCCLSTAAVAQETDSSAAEYPVPSSVEFFPILSYDTDVGLGYGVKLFGFNHLASNESIDIVLFNSTKGERWYRIVCALPDFESRQGTVYPLALDITVDYDKWIRNNFFGLGNSSAFADREYYTKESVELSTAFSSAFLRTLIGQAGLRFKAINNFNFEPDSRFPTLTSSSRTQYLSVYANIRFDTRNSFVNPTKGIVLQAETELAPGSRAFASLGKSAQWYFPLLHPNAIVALRERMQAIMGGDIPIHVLLPIGGNNTLRGSPQDRYLDRISAVVNMEVRFPVYWRLGGVVGVDAGKAWHRISEVDAKGWASNLVAGFRFRMETFVVRLDVGLGAEHTGVYFNFGQMF